MTRCSRCGRKITSRMYWTRRTDSGREDLCNHCAAQLIHGTRTDVGLLIAWNEDKDRRRQDVQA